MERMLANYQRHQRHHQRHRCNWVTADSTRNSDAIHPNACKQHAKLYNAVTAATQQLQAVCTPSVGKDHPHGYTG